MTAGRCYWIKDEDGDEILIPMCCGAAVYGSHACTCGFPESRIEAAERGRVEAEYQVLRLRDARDRRLYVQQIEWRQRHRLRLNIDRLRNCLEELACRHVTQEPLWWQEKARDALEGEGA